MAWVSDADQGGFSLPRLDFGGADCAGFGFVFGFGAAGWTPRDSGMVELLFQVADVRAGTLSGARSVHSIDEIEEYVAVDDGRGFDYALGRRVLRLRLARGLKVKNAGWQPALRARACCALRLLLDLA